MDSITLEKSIAFSTIIEEIKNINVNDSIDYKLLEDGCSVVGLIKINGCAFTLKGMEEFDENINIDIFAPFEHVIDKTKFSLKVDDYTYKIIRNIVVFKIKLKVNGFREINNNPVVQQADTDTYNLTNEIDELNEDVEINAYDEELLNEFKNYEEEPEIILETNEIKEPIENNKEKQRNQKPITWASELFTKKEKYVTFYKIHNPESDD